MFVFSLTLAFFAQGFGLTFSSATPNRLLTIYNANRVTWNHAVELCASKSGSLVTINEDSRAYIKQLSTSDWSSNWDEFWTGLHYVPSQFLWQSSCAELGSYRPWISNQSYEENSCVVADSELTEGAYLKTFACYAPRAKALCETVQGTCSFEHHLGKTVEVGNFDSVVVSAGSSEHCKTACLSYTGTPECWAAEYASDVHGNMICTLHFDVSSTAMKGRIEPNVANPIGITYHKICFSGALDSSSQTMKYTSSIDDKEPWSGCTSVMSQVTTTSEPIHDTTSGVTTSTGTVSKSHTSTDTTTTRGVTTTGSSTTIGEEGTASSSATNKRTSSSDPTGEGTTISDMTSELTTSSDRFSSDATNGDTTSRQPTSVGTTSGDTTSGGTSSQPTSGGTTSGDTTSGGTSSQPTSGGTTSGDTTSGGTSSQPTSGGTTGGDTTSGGTTTDGSTSDSPPSGGTTSGHTTSIPQPTETEDVMTTEMHRSISTTFAPLPSSSPVSNTSVQATPLSCCRCRQGEHLTEEQKRAIMAEIMASLSLNAKKVSAYQRRLISTKDSRLSAMTLGYFGVVMMVLFFGAIVVDDITYVVRDVKYFILKREVAADHPVRVQRSRRVISR